MTEENSDIQENKNDPNIYQTRDLNEATTLRFFKFDLVSIDFQIEGKNTVGYFNFENTPRLREAIDKFWDKELAVEPREFNSIKRGLKSRVTNGYKKPQS